MPLFARRRICSMLTDLSVHLTRDKFNELAKRLDHLDTKTALAAEAELTVLWGIARVAQMTTEPVLPNSASRPEASSDNLFQSCASVIEVRALSDESFSGRRPMERTANIIAAFADRHRKGAGKHLDFSFNERVLSKTRAESLR